MTTPMWQEVINFWFEEITPAQWWKKNDDFDALIKTRFSKIHHQASFAELAPWREEPLGRLAEIIVLDQFSRNIYRSSPLSFAQDSQALVLAQEAIFRGLDNSFDDNQRSFLLMPYMHSESADIHSIAVNLFAKLGNENNLDYELKHKKIIDRFGRYPHRNEILGRESTPDEVDFLSTPGSSF